MLINQVLSKRLRCVNARPSYGAGENFITCSLHPNTAPTYSQLRSHGKPRCNMVSEPTQGEPLCSGRKVYGPYESSDIFILHGAG